MFNAFNRGARAASLVAAIAATCAVTASADSGSKSEWKQLFNGKNLDGWKHVGPGEFVVENGVLKTVGGMGLLFVAAIISGVVLYAPFMRKLPFGTVRTSRSSRLKWLDYHNLLGIVALCWMTVVGLTGVINALATPIVEAWQMGELAHMTNAYAGKAALPPARYGSLDKAMAAAREALPGNNPQFIAFPGGAFSSKHHYAVFFQGASPLTERMLTPALIDAETGVLTDVRRVPWYVAALLYSQPLHFGDYGGLPLKMLWAILTIFTIVVLGSGLYLWLGKHRAPLAARVREVETGGAVVPAE